MVKYAVNELKIDPKLRKFGSLPLEDMTVDQLGTTLRYKGYFLMDTDENIGEAKIILAINSIENCLTPPTYVKLMTIGRYSLLDQITYLKEQGISIPKTISEYEIHEAYDALQRGDEIPKTNNLNSEWVAEKKALIIQDKLDVKEGRRELALYEEAGYKNAEDLAMVIAVYNDFIIKSIPKESVCEKYNISIAELNKAVEKGRSFRTQAMIPQEELYDKLIEVTVRKEALKQDLEMSRTRLHEFDERTKDDYYQFIDTFVNNKGDEQLIIRSIAKERKNLQDTLLNVNAALLTQTKFELELQGFIGGKSRVTGLQVNVVNNMGGGAAGGDPNTQQTNAVGGSYDKYLPYLEEKDQKLFKDVMDKLVEFYYLDVDNLLPPLPEGQ